MSTKAGKQRHQSHPLAGREDRNAVDRSVCPATRDVPGRDGRRPDRGHELKAQEARVVALMKTVEPELGDELHEQVTHLLCELSAYNIMHTIHQFMEATPKTRFRG